MKEAALLFLAAIALSACTPQPVERLVPPDYRSWRRLPEEPLRYQVPGHVNSARVVYVNPIGMAAARATAGASAGNATRFPDGTIIVKEIFPGLEADAGGTPEALTVMIKRSGHRLARGGWLWVTRDPSTGTEKVIDYELCYDCHAAANERHPYADKNPGGEFRDFVFLPYGLFDGDARQPAAR